MVVWLSFQSRGILSDWRMIGQGPAVLAASAGWGVVWIFSVSFILSVPLPAPTPNGGLVMIMSVGHAIKEVIVNVQ